MVSSKACFAVSSIKVLTQTSSAGVVGWRGDSLFWRKVLLPSSGIMPSLKIERLRVKRLVEVDWSEEDVWIS